MEKLKVGDKVKCVSPSDGMSPPGIGEVLKVDSGKSNSYQLCFVSVYFKGWSGGHSSNKALYGCWNFFNPSEQLELIKDTKIHRKFVGFEVGDTVMATGEGGKVKGYIDTITKLEPNKDMVLRNIPSDIWCARNKFWTVIARDGVRVEKEVGDKDSRVQTEVKIKMDKPNTKLEKVACKKAKEEAIKKAIAEKQKLYECELSSFMHLERDARSYRKLADEIAENLGITEKDKEDLL